MQKDVPGWHRQKEQLHAQHQTPTFQEREIWWCSVGVNVGHEMDGKHQFDNRPVLIVRTFNPQYFFRSAAHDEDEAESLLLPDSL
jgi:hypothetical protein